MKILNLICARSGSKGVKNKNIRLFNNVPLIVHTLDQCKKSKMIKDVYISTDSKKIADIAKKSGGIVSFMRPKKLAKDSTAEIYVWRHAIKEIEKKFKHRLQGICVIPVTSPLRQIKDIDNAIKKFLKTYKKIDMTCVMTESNKSPYFNMFEIKKKKVVLSKKTNKSYFNRQNCPKTFDLTTTIFLIKRNFVMENKDIRKAKINFNLIPKERSIDIDTEYDLKIANYLKKNEKRI